MARPDTPAVTVLLPARHAAETLAAAFSCVASQTLAELEILVLLNDADDATRRLAGALAAGEPRAAVIDAPGLNLAGTLNLGLRRARHGLCARMDADDLCTTDRLERQARAMHASRAAALGCAWEQRLHDARDGRLLAIIRPPTDPRELRWRLLIDNPLAHGSMMLRRDAVLARGGYDESLDRAQDYDLWLRLAREGLVAALPETLYTFAVRDTAGSFSSSAEQARVASALLCREWAALSAGDPNALSPAIEQALSQPGGEADAIREIDRILCHQPTATGLIARLWAQSRGPSVPARAWEMCRLARLREVSAALRVADHGAVWLWGAGAHTAWLISHAGDVGLRVAGVVDAARVGGMVGSHRVEHPDRLVPGDRVLLSSDHHEDALWAQSASARARGVVVHRLYAADEIATTLAGASSES